MVSKDTFITEIIKEGKSGSSAVSGKDLFKKHFNLRFPEWEIEALKSEKPEDKSQTYYKVRHFFEEIIGGVPESNLFHNSYAESADSHFSSLYFNLGLFKKI